MIEEENTDEEEIHEQYEPTEEELDKYYEEQAEKYWRDKW